MTHTWAVTCAYCGEVVSDSPEALADPLLDHWKEQCKAHPVYGGRNQQANSEQAVSKPWQFSVQLCSECYSKHREPRGATYSSRGTRCTNCGAEIHVIYWARTCWPVEGVGEDAIARVHHLADLTDYDKGYNAALGEIRRALNCCPTCSWPVRETVGLVCQACGTDYGDNDG